MFITGKQCHVPNSMKSSRDSRRSILAIALILVLFLGLAWTPGEATVNVFFSGSAPASLQGDLIAGLTTQYAGVLTASIFQPGAYTFTVTAKKSVPPPGACPACLVDVSSEPFVYGYVFGQEHERATDLGIINNYLVGCSTMSSCQVGLSSAAADVYQQSFSTPSLINPP